MFIRIIYVNNKIIILANCIFLLFLLTSIVHGAPYNRGPLYPELLPYNTTFSTIVCQSDFSIEQLDWLQSDLHELQEDLSGILGITISHTKIYLCLFHDWTSYRRFLQQKFPQAPQNRLALYIKDNGNGLLLILRDDKMRLNIRHELTHALLNASLKTVPIWLDEGLAKYFELPRANRNIEYPYSIEMYQSSDFSLAQVPSLKRLESLKQIEDMGRREYQESWSWIHFLICRSEDSQNILAYYLQTLSYNPPKSSKWSFLNIFARKLFLSDLLQAQLPDYRSLYLDHFKNLNRSSFPKAEHP